MGIAEAAIAFIVVGLPVTLLFVLASRALRHRERKLELEAEIAKAQAVRHGGSVARLEKRVRVLERIVTDKGIDLADEIEKLRSEAN